MEFTQKPDDDDEEEDEEAAEVAAFLRREVADWDDDIKRRARFKALSGQRSDWEPLYRFWRDLIINLARHLRTFTISPSRLQRLWFTHQGLSPLCLDRVLLEMHRAGDLLPPPNSPATATPTLSQIFRTTLQFLSAINLEGKETTLSGDTYLIAPILEEEALEVVKRVSEDHWSESCVITMRKFGEFCRGGSKEGPAILDYLSSKGKAKEFTIEGDDSIKGVKMCLASGIVSGVSNIDRTVLRLLSTAEKLERQLYLIDQRYEKSKNSALACLKSGNRKNALRYAKEMKLTSQSRDRCTPLLDRVEKVLNVIMDAEASKTVLEAVQSSTHAIRENQMSVDEVELCLQEVDETVDSLKQLDSALGAYGDVDDESIEDEFKKLELEVEGCAGESNVLDNRNDGLTDALSKLSLKEKRETKKPTLEEACLEPA